MSLAGRDAMPAARQDAREKEAAALPSARVSLPTAITKAKEPRCARL